MILTKEQFSSLCQEAYKQGTPAGYELAILREYLQSELLAIIYSQPKSESLALIGGTGLRLLYDLDRFSEDLDFDNLDASPTTPSLIFARAQEVIQERGYQVRFRPKRAQGERGGTLIFQNLLFPLGLSPHRNETIAIKLEYTSPSFNVVREIRFLNRFGFTVQVVTEPLEALCSRKISALILRRRLQPRDLYDLAWFFSHRVAPDLPTLTSLKINSYQELAAVLDNIFKNHQSKLASYERDLMPLLLDPAKTRVLRLLPDLTRDFLAKLIKSI